MISLLHYSNDCEGVGVDLSKDALMVAKANAERLSNNGISDKMNVNFVHSDLFENIDGNFDIIVSNPPYIPTAEIDTLQREVKDHEPRLALDGGADGLDIYRRIAGELGKYLKRGGMLIMEVGEGEAQDVVKLFQGKYYTMIAKDFNGIERYVKIIF